MFELHPQLAADTVPVHELTLSSLRLMNVAELPWLVLIPRREGTVDLVDLADEDQQQLMREISYVGKIVREEFTAHKLNIASLGNVVPQLHVHIVVRYTHDSAWPKPVWGNIAMDTYTPQELTRMTEKLRSVIV